MFNDYAKNFLFDLILDNYPKDKKLVLVYMSAYNKIAGNFKDNTFTDEEAQAMVNLLQLEIINGNEIDLVKQLQAWFNSEIREVV